MATVIESIDAYREHNDNKNPGTAISTPIEYGSFAGLVTWGAVSTALKNGSNGLKEDPDYLEWKKDLEAKELEGSLAQLILTLGYDIEKRDLTIALIKESMDL